MAKKQAKGNKARQMRNNQIIIIIVAIAMVISMGAVFSGLGGRPAGPSGGTSVTDLVNLGNWAYDEGKFADAIKYYEKALEANPNLVGVWTDLGTSYWYLQPPLPTKAIECYDRAIELEPTFINAYYNKGIVLLYGLNKPAEAIEVWQKVLDLNPPQAYSDQINNTLIPEARARLQ
ncbi:MAG: tetratricopeptide repeat protein [Firmicutes bacterium]|nr:tetratricopeptide repeat protein [Bacillota bacterium]